jgi:hypothetical protein
MRWSTGLAEETIPFYGILIPVMLTAGYDALTAVATVLVGAGVGVLGSTVNPFATVIASDAAAVPFTAGLPGAPQSPAAHVCVAAPRICRHRTGAVERRPHLAIPRSMRPRPQRAARVKESSIPHRLTWATPVQAND